MNNWSPEFEMDYVRQTGKEPLLERINAIIDIFQVQFVRRWSFGTLADIGCGPVGGVAAVASPLGPRIAIDPLMGQYEPLGWIPECVERRSDFAHALSLDDKSVDILFCLECLDHCDDMDQFWKSQQELARVLAPGGLFCFMLPARSEPRDGHPCNPCSIEVRANFESLGLRVIEWKFYGKDERQKEGTWLKMTK